MERLVMSCDRDISNSGNNSYRANILHLASDQCSQHAPTTSDVVQVFAKFRSPNPGPHTTLSVLSNNFKVKKPTSRILYMKLLLHTINSKAKRTKISLGSIFLISIKLNFWRVLHRDYSEIENLNMLLSHQLIYLCAALPLYAIFSLEGSWIILCS